MMLIFKILSCLDRNLQVDSTKHIWKCKRPGIVKAVLKKDVFGGLSLLDFKTYYKATQVWHKDRQIDEWDIMESPEINPYIYDQLILNNVAKVTQWGKKVFSVNGSGTSR